MGGIVIVLSLLLLQIIINPFFSPPPLLYSGFFVIVLCGILDDTIHLKWHIKIVFHGISAFLLTLYFETSLKPVSVAGFLLSPPFDFVLSFFLILLLINALNFLDGLDGLLTGYSTVLFIVSAVLCYSLHLEGLSLLAVAMTGILAAFTIFNSFPAKLFLGDTGSLSLGYLLIFLIFSLAGKTEGDNTELIIPMLFFTLPLADMFRVIIGRIIRRRKPWLPDKTHLHHLLLDKFNNHKYAKVILLFYSLFFIAVSVDFVISKIWLRTLVLTFVLLVPLVSGNIFPEIISNSLNFRKNIHLPGWILSAPLRKSIVIFLSLLLILALALFFPYENGSSDTNLYLLLMIPPAIFILFEYACKYLSKSVAVIFNIFLSLFTVIGSQTDLPCTLIYFLLLPLIIFLLSFPFILRYSDYKNKILISGFDLLLIFSLLVFYLITFILENNELFLLSLITLYSSIYYFWTKTTLAINRLTGRLFYYLSYIYPILTGLFILSKEIS